MKSAQVSRYLWPLLVGSCLLLSACGGGGGGDSSASVPANYFFWKEPSGITLPAPVNGTASGSVNGDFSNGDAILTALASVSQPVKIETGSSSNNPDSWYKDGELQLQKNSGDGTWTFTLTDSTGATVGSYRGYAWLFEGAIAGISANSMELFLSPSNTSDPRFGSGDIFDISLNQDAHLYAWYNPTSGDDVWFGNGLVDSHGEKVFTALTQLTGTWTGTIDGKDAFCADATTLTLTIDSAGTATFATNGTDADCTSLHRTLTWSALSDNEMQETAGNFAIDLDGNSDDYELELGVDDWQNPTKITYVDASRGQAPNDHYVFANTLTKQP